MPMTIAIHEAAHAVVASALGFRDVHVTRHDGCHATGFSAPEEPTPNEHFMLAAVSLAGGLAECEHLGCDTPEGALEDLQLAVESIAAYLCLDEVPPEGSNPEMTHALTQAAELSGDIVVSRWEAVRRLAEALTRHEELSSEQVATLLRDPE